MGCTSSATSAAREEAPTFHAKYHVGEKLGMGAFAQVHLCTERNSQASFAVKIPNLFYQDAPIRQDKLRCKSVLMEMAIWNQIGKHENCVQLHEFFVEDLLCYMVMEKCDTPFVKHLESLPRITEKSLSGMFRQMLQGISHIHSVNVLHRDIKPDNFLVGGQNGCTIKLADFGLSVFVLKGGKVPGVAGTVAFMSPEMINMGEADQKTDVWSFGVVAHILLCGKWPYSSDCTVEGMKQAIAQGNPLEFKSPWLSRQAAVFLQGLLERDTRHRVSADEARRMEYILTCEKDEGMDLRPLLQGASEAGILFDPLVGTHLDHIDTVLQEAIKSRKYGIHPTNILNQTIGNDLKMNTFAVGDDDLKPDGRNANAHEDSMSNISTCASSVKRD